MKEDDWEAEVSRQFALGDAKLKEEERLNHLLYGHRLPCELCDEPVPGTFFGGGQIGTSLLDDLIPPSFFERWFFGPCFKSLVGKHRWTFMGSSMLTERIECELCGREKWDTWDILRILLVPFSLALGLILWKCGCP